MVYFDIVGTEFEPAEVTHRLGIEPTESWKRGDDIPMRPGRNSPPSKRNHTAWKISTGYEESMDVGIQANKILRQISGKANEIVSIRNEISARLFLRVVIEIEDSAAPIFAMAPEYVRFLANIGADIDIDLYVI